ncbi:hypothetical protein E2C01_098412 [Portunus trituberculatus]|uniref:Secreted protein n=1 Tax=Portunus trituberculatus TaxID=210409 RepID=A0A5B7K8B7_PORTR|nr:hypothetical protein [Portunus trituberculatus]
MTEASRISRLLCFLLRCNLIIFNNIKGWDQIICYNTSAQSNHCQKQTAAPSSSKLSASRPLCLRALKHILDCQSHHCRSHYTSTAFERLQPQAQQIKPVQTGCFRRSIGMVLPILRSPVLPSSEVVTACRTINRP